LRNALSRTTVTPATVTTRKEVAVNVPQPATENAPTIVDLAPAAAERERSKVGEATTGATTKTMPRRPRDQ